MNRLSSVAVPALAMALGAFALAACGGKDTIADNTY
jgi:hypothetical protein